MHETHEFELGAPALLEEGVDVGATAVTIVNTTPPEVVGTMVVATSNVDVAWAGLVVDRVMSEGTVRLEATVVLEIVDADEGSGGDVVAGVEEDVCCRDVDAAVEAIVVEGVTDREGNAVGLEVVEEPLMTLGQSSLTSHAEIVYPDPAERMKIVRMRTTNLILQREHVLVDISSGRGVIGMKIYYLQ